MDFTHLNKILERSFAQVKKDILKLKEEQLEAEKKLSEVKEKSLGEEKIEGVKSELRTVEYDVRLLTKQVAFKTEINAKLLTIYKSMKKKDEAEKRLKDINKDYEKVLQNQLLILKKLKDLEESKLDFDSLKNTFVETQKFDKEQKTTKELRLRLKKSQVALDKVENKSKDFAMQKDYTSLMLDVKKNFETIVSELNRLDIETVKTSEAGKVKARITRLENLVKELKKAKEVKKAPTKKKPAAKKAVVKKPVVKKAPAKKPVLKKAEVEKEIKKEVKKVVKHPSKAPAAPKPTEQEEGKLFKKAIDSVIDYFTEVPETEVVKPADKTKPAASKKSASAKKLEKK